MTHVSATSLAVSTVAAIKHGPSKVYMRSSGLCISGSNKLSRTSKLKMSGAISIISVTAFGRASGVVMNPGPKGVVTSAGRGIICMTAHNRSMRTKSCGFTGVSYQAGMIARCGREMRGFTVSKRVTCLCGCGCDARATSVGAFGLGAKRAIHRGFVASKAGVDAPCKVGIGPCDKGVCVASTCSCAMCKSLLYFGRRKRLLFHLGGVKLGPGAVMFDSGTSQDSVSSAKRARGSLTFTGGM